MSASVQTYPGVYSAKVYSTADPGHANRIQMLIPQIFGTTPVRIWAPPLVAGATIPSVGEMVWCTFQGGDPAFPTYMPSNVGGNNGTFTQMLTAPTVASSPYTITHNLNTTTPLVQLWDVVTGQMVMAQITVVNANSIQVTVAANMPHNLNVVVHGSPVSPVPVYPGDLATKSYVDLSTAPNLASGTVIKQQVQAFLQAATLTSPQTNHVWTQWGNTKLRPDSCWNVQYTGSMYMSAQPMTATVMAACGVSVPGSYATVAWLYFNVASTHLTVAGSAVNIPGSVGLSGTVQLFLAISLTGTGSWNIDAAYDRHCITTTEIMP